MPGRDRRPPPTPGGRDASRARAADAMLAFFTGGVAQGSRRDIIARVGGTREAARITGYSQRQMRRWASGETRTPRNAAAVAALNRADAIARIRAAGTRLDDSGLPSEPAFVRAAGYVRVNGDEYGRDREIGGNDLGWKLADDTISDVVGAVADDRPDAVQAAIEDDISSTAGLDYDPDTGTGMYLDRLDEFSVRQRPDAYW